MEDHGSQVASAFRYIQIQLRCREMMGWLAMDRLHDRIRG
jgi:hypothetical protein